MAFIRDLIYLDFDKAASIYSQISDGLRQNVTDSSDKVADQEAGAKFGIPKVAEAKLGAAWTQKTSSLESRILHHDVLRHVEDGLVERNLVSDLTAFINSEESSPDEIRSAIGTCPYVVAKGTAVIEDYQRMLAILDNYNGISELIDKSAREALKDTPEYEELQLKVDNIRKEVEKNKNRSEKHLAKRQLKELEQELQNIPIDSVGKLENWLQDGIKLFINTFVPNRINLRVYPFSKCPSFQVICNLKRDCFVDQDLEHLLYGYGNFPNVPVGVLGLITSLPPKEPSDFDPLEEFPEDVLLSKEEEFEKVFRNMFSALDGLEKFMRYSRYPNITIHPIAVYRHFEVASCD